MRMWILFAAASISGCGADTLPAPPKDSINATCLNDVVVHPAFAVLAIGDTARFSATGGGSGCNSSPIVWRWRSSDTVVAVVDSVSGLARARKAGTATIIAEDSEDRNQKGATALTVKP